MVILTEKKSIAENYAKALGIDTEDKGGEFISSDGKMEIAWASGHLYRLKEPGEYEERWIKWNWKELPIKVEKYGIMPDISKKKTTERLEKILQEAKRKGKEIVIATDPDREGEVIAGFILWWNGIERKDTTRIWVNEGLDRKEIIRGIRERKSSTEYGRIYDEGFCAKKADWLLGMNLSRAYSAILKDAYSVGRVQTAVLKEIYRREKAIKDYKRKPYFKIKCTLEDGTSSYLLNRYDEKNPEHFGEEYGEKLDEMIRSIPERIRVTGIERKRKTLEVPLLYDLSGLEMDGYRIYGIGVDRVLEIAEVLYNEKGVLSYPRTDSRCMGDEDVGMIREMYERYLLKNSMYYKAGGSLERVTEANRRIFNSKKKHAHHALIPSNWFREEDSEEWRIWDLVMRRFMMQGCSENITEYQKVTLNGNGMLFTAEGKKTVLKGWKALSLEKEKEGKELDYEEGQELRIVKAEIERKMTEPPEHYNEATLIAWMKNPQGKGEEGIEMMPVGTEATRAETIKKLYGRKYIAKRKKHIEILEKGARLIEEIRKNRVIEKSTDAEATAMWDRMVKEDPGKFYRRAESEVMEMMKGVWKDMETVNLKEKITDCPFCEGEIYKGQKKFYCSNWKEKECRYSLNFVVMGNEFDESTVMMLKEKKETPFMTGVTKTGEKCSFRIKEGDGEYVMEYAEAESLGKCPVCGNGEMYPKAKVYKCSNADCGYFMWKETSGIKIDRETAGRLIRGEEFSVKKTRKDGSREEVKVSLNDKGDLNIRR